MRKILLLVLCIIAININSEEFIKPKQLYTTTETHFGNQEWITFDKNIVNPIYNTNFMVTPQTVDGGSGYSSGSGSVTETRTADDGTLITVTLYYNYTRNGRGNISITYTYNGVTYDASKNSGSFWRELWDLITGGNNTASTVDKFIKKIAEDIADEELEAYNNKLHNTIIGECWVCICFAFIYILNIMKQKKYV